MEYQARWLWDFYGLKISETLIVSWITMIFLIIASILLTRNLKKVPTSKVQLFLEVVIDALRNFVTETVGAKIIEKVPWLVSYIGSLFLFFVFSNIAPLFGFRSPTTDLDTTFGWTTITIILMYGLALKFRPKEYLKEFFEPTPLMFPLHVIGELSRPISLSFRPFGNILGGTIIMSLVYKLLHYITSMLPVPIAQFLIPVPLHIYFDVFEGALQAFIFIMLTMIFISSVATVEDVKSKTCK